MNWLMAWLILNALILAWRLTVAMREGRCNDARVINEI